MTKEQAIAKLLEQHDIDLPFDDEPHYSRTVIKTLLEKGWYTFDDGETYKVAAMVTSYRESIMDMLQDYDHHPVDAKEWLELSMQCNEVAQIILLLEGIK